LAQNTDAGLASAQALCGAASNTATKTNPILRRILFSLLACRCSILSNRGMADHAQLHLNGREWSGEAAATPKASPSLQ
jgi:hypothetical protein